MQIHIDAHELLLQAKRFKGLKANLQRAIREGLNQGGNKVATDVRRALMKQTGLKKYSYILALTRTVGASAGGSGLWSMAGHESAGGADFAFQIVCSGEHVPIYKFFPYRVSVGPGGGVTSSPWNVRHQFKRSFVTKKGYLRARLPGQRITYTDKDGKTRKGYKLRSLYGPSIAKEAMKGVIPRVFETSVMMQVQPIILARLARALQSSK